MTTVQQQLLGALLLACLPVGLIVYARLVLYVRRKGGRVRTDGIALPDAMVAAVLVGFLVQLTVKMLMRGETAEPPKITAEQVLPNVVVFLGVLTLLLAFLYSRRVDVPRFFGLRGLKAGRALVLALGFIVSAYPLLLLVGAITQTKLGGKAVEQDLVGIFREAVSRMNVRALVAIAIAGAITQPVVEEVFFRGYFYVVGKRYFGGIASAVGTSALFAAVHLNLTAFPALFVLALCLTLAYEVTGSILVPIGMHALFNTSQLAFLAWQAHAIPPQ